MTTNHPATELQVAQAHCLKSTAIAKLYSRSYDRLQIRQNRFFFLYLDSILVVGKNLLPDCSLVVLGAALEFRKQTHHESPHRVEGQMVRPSGPR